MKKIIICLFLLVSFSFIYCDGIPAEGCGSYSEPYLISSLDNLLWLSTTDSVWSENVYFLQTNDINAAETLNWNDGAGFLGIGWLNEDDDNQPFMGNYDGGSYLIDSLYINRPETKYIGFFGYTLLAEITNLGLTNLDVTGYLVVGGIVGKSYSDTQIYNCYTDGVISGERIVGGITGVNYCYTIDRCNSDCIVTGESEVGGIAGYSADGIISECYFTGSVFGEQVYGGITGSYYNPVMNESFYDYESVLINNQHLITLGAVTSELFNTWLDNDLNLEISDYLNYDSGNYLINDFENLEKLLAFGQCTNYRFFQTDDIDLSNHQNFYIPYFASDYNGNNNEITGFHYDVSQGRKIGIFGYVCYAEIESIRLSNIDINGNDYIGGITGCNHFSSISDCHVTGNISGNEIIGGIAGYNHFTNIAGCYTNCTINSYHISGGLIGLSINSEIVESASCSNLTGEWETAGLIGRSENSFVLDNYVIGNVNGLANSAGLIAVNTSSTIVNNYVIADVTGDYDTGGLIGCSDFSVISNCIWNIDICSMDSPIGYSGIDEVTNLLGLSSNEMQNITSYTDIGWDFVGESTNGDEDIWDINPNVNNGYPYLYDFDMPVSSNDILEPNAEVNIYPNPFNPLTRVAFELKKSSNIMISVYNLKGQRLEVICNTQYKSGRHDVIWNAENYPSGIYLLKFQTSLGSYSRKVTLLK